MSDNTKIEWADATLNYVNGCSLASPGCTNCYAMRAGGRNLPNHPSTGLTVETKAGHVWTGEVRENPAALQQALKWKRGRKIFWNAHGDIFHDAVPDEWIDRLFAVCALTPQHTHMILTKRSARMRAYMAQLDIYVLEETEEWRTAQHRVDCDDDANGSDAWHERTAQIEDAIDQARDALDAGNPLPNVWLGVSVEDQTRADERIPDLLATPAAVRFISAEPLLGPVDLGMRATFPDHIDRNGRGYWGGLPRLDWVIVGGENGPRPMHPDWVRSLRDQCQSAGVAFHFKQWGEYAPSKLGEERSLINVDRDGSYEHSVGIYSLEQALMAKLGKRRAGRLLDGRTWDEMPS